MLTQLARSSEALKVELRDVSMTVTPHFEQTGSIVAGTAASRLLDVETLAVSRSPEVYGADVMWGNDNDDMLYGQGGMDQMHGGKPLTFDASPWWTPRGWVILAVLTVLAVYAGGERSAADHRRLRAARLRCPGSGTERRRPNALERGCPCLG